MADRPIAMSDLGRTKCVQALETQIGVLTRRVNAEKNDAIKKILEEDVKFLRDLQNTFR